MNRKIYYWKLRESELQLGERTLIMGVLNVTPDSFSDGGRFNDPDAAYARALELEEQGADIIDIGAESTRPGSHRISADEEWQRLVPVLKRLKGNLRVPLSLDTYKSEIAERAVQYGIEIFNDPSGLTYDPNLAKIAANANAGLILNHMRGTPENWAKLPPMQDPVGTIARDLDATISRARMAGVDRTRIVVDPGLGFGKRKEQNADILAHLPRLAALDYPILVGPSRKHFLAQASENDTLYATAAAVTASILNGAYIVRVHDVKEMQPVVHVADEIAAMAGASARMAEAAEEERKVLRRTAELASAANAERARPARPPIARPINQPPQPAPPAARPPEFRPPAPQRAEFRPQARDGSRPPSRRPIDKPDFRKPDFKKRDPEERFRSESRPPSRPQRDFRPGAKPDFKSPKPDFKSLRPDFKSAKPDFKNSKPEFKGARPAFKGKRREEGPPQGRPPKRPFRKRP
jgi:dihydropteroate synthase